MTENTGPEPLTPEHDVSLERELRRELGADGNELIEIFKFGLDAQQFLENSHVGQYIVLHAEAMAADAMLVITDASDLTTAEVKEAHLSIKVAKGILAILQEAVSSGVQAEESIRSIEMMDMEQSDG